VWLLGCTLWTHIPESVRACRACVVSCRVGETHACARPRRVGGSRGIADGERLLQHQVQQDQAFLQFSVQGSWLCDLRSLTLRACAHG
jgi:hypothetical protein